MVSLLRRLNNDLHKGNVLILIFSIYSLVNKKFYFVNGFWKVEPEISAFQENLQKYFGFPIS